MINQPDSPLMHIPRELRDCVYTHIIVSPETDVYDECGIAMVLADFATLLLICKQFTEEFTEAIVRKTRVGVDGYLDKKTLMAMFPSVPTRLREQTQLLAINVAGVPNIAPLIPDLRQEIANGLMNVVKYSVMECPSIPKLNLFRVASDAWAIPTPENPPLLRYFV
jgi:hypothetical protein